MLTATKIKEATNKQEKNPNGKGENNKETFLMAVMMIDRAVHISELNEYYPLQS